MVNELSNAGFKCYETRVGGDGFGVKVPRGEEEAAEAKVRFQEARVSTELAGWVEGQQGWVFA